MLTADIAEGKISEFEALQQKLAKKTILKKSIIPVSCWTTSSSQIKHVIGILKEESEQKSIKEIMVDIFLDLLFDTN